MCVSVSLHKTFMLPSLSVKHHNSSCGFAMEIFSFGKEKHQVGGGDYNIYRGLDQDLSAENVEITYNYAGGEKLKACQSQ